MHQKCARLRYWQVKVSLKLHVETDRSYPLRLITATVKNTNMEHRKITIKIKGNAITNTIASMYVLDSQTLQVVQNSSSSYMQKFTVYRVYVMG